jgi:hypothetical protein
MARKTRVRDAVSGQIVAAEEAVKRPRETVTEDTSKDGLEKRLALLERVVEEGGGPLAVLYRRRKRGLVD